MKKIIKMRIMNGKTGVECEAIEVIEMLGFFPCCLSRKIFVL